MKLLLVGLLAFTPTIVHAQSSADLAAQQRYLQAVADARAAIAGVAQAQDIVRQQRVEMDMKLNQLRQQQQEIMDQQGQVPR